MEAGLAFYFFKFIFILIFGRSGSSLLLRLFSSCGQQDYSLVAVCGLLNEVASLVREHQAPGVRAQWLQFPGSRAQAQ